MQTLLYITNDLIEVKSLILHKMFLIFVFSLQIHPFIVLHMVSF